MLISILRTVVPALWGSFIVWLLGLVPVFEPLREDLLAYADLAVPIIAGVIIGAWYAFWRWLEPKLPDWATRILLGSAHAPAYAPAVRVGIDQETIDRTLGSIQRSRDGENIEQAFAAHADQAEESFRKSIPGTTLDLGATEADPERYEQ